MKPEKKNMPSFIFRQQFLFFFLLLIAATGKLHAAGSGPGTWQLLQKSIGIVSMHMQLLHNDHVIIFDRTDFGKSNLSLPNGQCRSDPDEKVLPVDCTAHSVDYDVLNNAFRPLMVQTNVWCSSGAAMPDGTLVQTGGFNDGEHVVRVVRPCDTCDWEELGKQLVVRRWYASNQILPDGRQIIIGGRRQFNYEFYPKSETAKNVYSSPFLVQTNDHNQENNLYPFVFLNGDGYLFIVANNRAILFDYSNNKVVKSYPTIPGGDPRNYPSSGSAVLLPIKNLQASTVEAEVLVCGGAPKGSYLKVLNGTFIGALNTCARIKINDPNPQWVMEAMPLTRVMGDMVLLPNGNVLIINGAARGTAGWEYGRDPVFQPVIYRPSSAVGSRFELQNPNTIPRMYHSTAVLLRDGRVLVSGSNPHIAYRFSGVLFPTELSVEAFSPSYLDSQFDPMKPKIISPASQTKISYGQVLRIRFSVTGSLVHSSVTTTMVFPSFNTHSFSMNQRLLVLGTGNVTTVGKSTYEVAVTSPNSGNLAPPGYYILFVVHQDVPSQGIWVQIGQ